VLTAEEIAKNVAALKDKGGGSSAKGGKAKGGRVLRSGYVFKDSDPHVDGKSSASPSPSPSRKASSNATAKLMRKWNDTAAVSTEDMAALDFSSPADENLVVDTEGLVSEDALGTVAKDGSYEVADWDFRRGKPSSNENDGLLSEDEIIARGASRLGISAIKSADEDDEPEAEGLWASMFSRIKGNKVLTADDLKPVLGEMEKHLMSKNVAKDIAEKLCEGVGSALAGKKLSGFSSRLPHGMRYACANLFKASSRKFRLPCRALSPAS
jgi:signal recognition particle receptor subunit alpha